MGITARIELNCRTPRGWWRTGADMHTPEHGVCCLKTETSNTNPPTMLTLKFLAFNNLNFLRSNYVPIFLLGWGGGRKGGRKVN